MKLVCVDPARIGEFWPHFSHLIKDAFEANESDDSFADTEKELLEGKCLLWLAAEDLRVLAAAVTKIWNSPSKKVCSVVAVGGTRMADWKDSCLPKIEEYAASEGCDVVRLSGRRGWMRVFKSYAEPWVTLEKRL